MVQKSIKIDVLGEITATEDAWNIICLWAMEASQSWQRSGMNGIAAEARSAAKQIIEALDRRNNT